MGMNEFLLGGKPINDQGMMWSLLYVVATKLDGEVRIPLIDFLDFKDGVKGNFIAEYFVDEDTSEIVFRVRNAR